MKLVWECFSAYSFICVYGQSESVLMLTRLFVFMDSLRVF
jgi:hypothetical protein